MLFNSLEYLLFLPITFLLYWLVFKPLGRKWQNCFIVVASYFFYGCWDWRFLVLIAITTISSYVSGLLIEGTARRKLWLWINVAINLGILGMYKYYNFFAENLAEMMSRAGIVLDDVTLDLVLPVGISFYTFQALSYSIDVYRGKIKATRDVVAFFAYISFFPQLVAGPIERASNLLPQFLCDRKFDYATAVDGMRQILWGLFKKMVVADNCAVIVNGVFASYQDQNGMTLCVAAILFSFQIYGDFSGYSDIAIGTAKLFGIKLMRNFNVPYFSRDVSEFWRKWHISLNTWFVDYIYIPLGGSRCKKSKVARNTATIFLVSGLWHGANWTYVVWGAYHALLFMPMILLGKNRKYLTTVAPDSTLPTVREITMIFFTFALVTIGWVIFRATNITEAWDYLVRMFTQFSFTLDFPGKFALLWVALMILVEWWTRHRNHGFDFKANRGLMKYTVTRWTIYAVTFILCLSLSGESNEFIYFQF